MTMSSLYFGPLYGVTVLNIREYFCNVHDNTDIH